MSVTSAQLQAQLGTNPNSPQILQDFGVRGTQQHWYIRGGIPQIFRTKFVATTAANSAANQATEVLTALTAGPV
jgi:hypothetical protein